MKRLLTVTLALGLLAVPGLAADRVLVLDDSTFNDRTKGKIVVVDFYADWCGPCVAFAPTFKAVAGKVTEGTFVKVNTDNSPKLSAAFAIRFIPYIVSVKDGKVIEQYKGARTEEDFATWCRAQFAKGGGDADKKDDAEKKDETLKLDRSQDGKLPGKLNVWTRGDQVVNQAVAGWRKTTLPIVNHYKGEGGVYIAVYSKIKDGSYYSVGGGIYVMGLIRVKGTWQGRIAIPDGYDGKDISAERYFKRMANAYFPTCLGEGWVGGDTGGFFGQG